MKEGVSLISRGRGTMVDSFLLMIRSVAVFADQSLWPQKHVRQVGEQGAAQPCSALLLPFTAWC